MKLPPLHRSRFTLYASRPRCRKSGFAVIVVMALLVIIMVFVAGNIRTLYSLGRELRLLERQQTHRLQTTAQATNSPPAKTIVTNAAPSLPNP